MENQREVKKSVKSSTFQGLGNLLKLLPTGTMFLYQFVNPIATNYGDCHNRPVNKILSSIFVAFCGFFCVQLASFTDSYVDSEGRIRYAFVTTKGLRRVPNANKELASAPKYRLTLGDFVHAFLSLVVFAVVVVLDSNSVRCFYPGLEDSQKKLIMVMPLVVSCRVPGFRFPCLEGMGLGTLPNCKARTLHYLCC